MASRPDTSTLAPPRSVVAFLAIVQMTDGRQLVTRWDLATGTRALAPPEPYDERQQLYAAGDHEVAHAMAKAVHAIASYGMECGSEIPVGDVPGRGKVCRVHDWAHPCAPCQDELAGVVGRRCLVHHYTLPCHDCSPVSPSCSPRERTVEQQSEYDARRGGAS